MSRSPKRRARGQLVLDLRPRTRAGKPRKKMGRRPSGKRRDPRHRTRSEVLPGHPVHVVLRVTESVASLRGQRAYRAVRGALTCTLARADFRVVHVSIQSNHVHLLVEAEHKVALSRGMQGFAISAAKRLNRELRRRRGDVFAYRYHATAITTPTQARNALSYILNNWRHHRADRGMRARLDPFATGHAFAGWSRPHDQPQPPDPLPVARATAWLLLEGWQRAGPIAFIETPGPDPMP